MQDPIQRRQYGVQSMDVVEGRRTVLCNVGEVDERELTDRLSLSPPLPCTSPFLLCLLFPSKLNTQPFALTTPNLVPSITPSCSLCSYPIALLAPLKLPTSIFLSLSLSLSVSLFLSVSVRLFRDVHLSFSPSLLAASVCFASIHETASRESVSLGKYQWCVSDLWTGWS